MSASREKKKRQEQAADLTAAQETKKGMSKGVKRALTAVIALVLVAAIVFLGLVSSGFFTTHTTAAIANGHKLSPAMLNYYYSSTYQNMSQLLSYMTDSETPLSEQAYMTDEFATWNDYLLDYSLANAASTYAMYDEALANGYELSADAQSSVDTTLQTMELYASMYGYSTDAFIAANYGTGCNLDSYREYLTVNYTAQEYASSVYSGFDYTQDEIDAYYAEHSGDFDSVSFRQFTISAIGDVDEEGNTTYSDEALAEAEATAKAMAEAAQGDEQAFLDLSLENTAEENQEGYDASTSTLRDEIAINNCSEDFRDWLTDDARQTGDTTYVFNGTASYYVLYFLEQCDHDYLLPNVRHILIGVDDTTDEEAMAAAKDEAQALLNQFLAGDATEDSFAALANENTDDTGSNTTGGLYENVAPGSMVDSFDAWCFEDGRQAGDTDIIESEYGYHIMYYCGLGTVTYHNHEVEEAMISNAYTEWQSGITNSMTYELLNSRYLSVH